ncbi:MAG: OmpH family outer membrane protein [Acidobacteriota bacterium]
MGNRGRLYAVLGALFAVAGIGLAFGQGSRIAFVNSQEILYQTDQGKEGLAELEQYMNQQRQQFDARNKELTDLQQDYQFKRGSLSAEAAAKMEGEIQQKQVALKRFQEDIQADLNQRQDRLIQQISQKVQQVIEEYAKEQSFDAIFMRDQNQAWVSPNLDVTPDIITRYNQKFPGKATTPAAAPQQGAQQPGQ